MAHKPDPICKSKRIYSTIVLLIVFVAGIFGLELSEDIQQSITEVFVIAGTLVSMVLTIWSKIKELLDNKKNEDN